MANAKIVIGSTGGQVNFSKVTSPDTPPAGYVAMYAQNVSGTDTIRAIDSAGNIINFGGAGSAGTNGTSGTSGSSGSSGSSGLSGSSGSSGSSGANGTSGTSGANGTSGSSGSSGSSGTSGSSGSSGTAGTSGNGFDWEGTWSNLITYFKNDTVYYNGSTWIALTTIASGGAAPDVNPNWDLVALAGTSGTSGSSGSSGTSGVSGSSGSSGTSGSDGTSGVNGTSGSSGSSGTSGSSGGTGSSGSSGSSGTSGGDGSSGSSGTSGITSAPTPIIEINTNTLVSDATGATAGASNDSVVIGATADGRLGDRNIAIGFCAKGSNLYDDVDRGAIAIGANSKSEGRETIAIGDSACAQQSGYAIAIGRLSNAADSAIAIGNVAFAGNNGGTIAIGDAARANGNYSLAIGFNACQCPGSNESIVFGRAACIDGERSNVIGKNACAIGNDGISIGTCAKTICNGGYVNNAIAIGTCASAQGQEGTGTIAIGFKACVANKYRGIAIGECVQDLNGNGSTLVGQFLTSASHNNAMFGNSLCSLGANVVVMGIVNKANVGGVAIGAVANWCITTPGECSVSIGWQTCSCGNHSIVIGTEGLTNSAEAITIGKNSSTTAAWSTTIGSDSCSSSACSVTLGRCSCATHDGAVVLGPSQTSKVSNHTHVTNMYFSSPTGPYASDACFYAAGGTGGQTYLLCVGSDSYLTVAGYN